MKRKILPLCLTLSLCLALAAGCARQTPAPRADAAGAQSESAPKAAEPETPAPEAKPETPAPEAEPETPAPRAMTYRIEHTDLSEGCPVDMYFEIPVFEGDSAAAETINADFAALRSAYIEGEAADVLEMVREDMGSEYGPTEETPYINTHTAVVETCTEELVSVVIGYDWYMGGVMDYGVDTYSYNAQTGERVYLDDLLDGSEAEIRESIVAALLEQYPGIEEAGVMETPMDAVRAKDIRDFHFYVLDGAVHIAFNKYEITYGAAGAFDVALPDALKSLG